MKYIKGYRSVAILQMLTCIAFFINPGIILYGLLFGIINFFAAGVIFAGSFVAYFRPKKWILWTMVITMCVVILFNVPWFISHNTFITTGFPLIAYDLLFIIVTLHFLGKGL